MNVQKVGSYFLIVILFFSFVGVVSTAGTSSKEGTQIKSAICEIVKIVKAVMGAAMLVLIVLAAIVYAAGQVMGAETRARANVWATSMFVGAVVGALIYIVVPVFLGALLPDANIDTACGGAQGGTSEGAADVLYIDPGVLTIPNDVSFPEGDD